MMSLFSSPSFNQCIQDFDNQRIAPGFTMAYYENNIWHTFCHGVLDDRDMAVDQESYYDIASVTKSIIATIILELVKDNLLSLTDKVSHYLEFLEDHNTLIQDLLIHASGLRYPVTSRSDCHYSVDEITHIISCKDTLVYDSSKKVYNDLNYIYLGWIIERIVQQNLGGYVKSFLEKYGIDGITYVPKSVKIAATEQGLGIGIVQDEKARYLGGIAGSAGLFATIHGLQKFVTAWLHNSFMLSNDLYQQSFACLHQAKNPEACYGLVWRQGIASTKPNISGYTGSHVVVDFTAQKAFIILTNLHRYERDASRKELLRKRYHPILDIIGLL